MADVHQLILDYGAETAKVLSKSKLERQCLDTAMAVMGDDRFDLNLLHSGFALTALPHRNTKETIWQRTGGQNGEIKLHVELGIRTGQTAHRAALWFDRPTDPNPSFN